MISPSISGDFRDDYHDLPHATHDLHQYFEPAQSSSSSFGLTGSEPVESSDAVDPDPWWFTDFILYDSEHTDFQPESMSVSSTSGSARMEMDDGVVMIPPFPSLSSSVPTSTESSVSNSTDSGRWPNSTDLDEADYAAVSSSSSPIAPWNPAEPALRLPISHLSEDVSDEEMNQSPSEHSFQIQNDAAGRFAVPRLRIFQCPTCNSPYSSEMRLSEHLQRSHPPARFTCCTCNKGFKQKKDLQRHERTHEPLIKPFACSCNNKYARYDGLLRHVAEMAQRPGEALWHTAVRPNLG